MRGRSASDFDTGDIGSIAGVLPTIGVVAYALATTNFTRVWIANGVLACAASFKVRSSRARFVRSHRADGQGEPGDRRTGGAAHA